MNKYTSDDIPNILNSISWQLKRIADSLENNKSEVLKEKVITPNNNIRELLKNLNANCD